MDKVIILWLLFTGYMILQNYSNYRFLDWIIICCLVFVPLITIMSKKKKNIQTKSSNNSYCKTSDNFSVIQKSKTSEINTRDKTIIKLKKIFNIPNDVFELLWFADGEFKNYNFIDKKTISDENNFIQITFSDSSSEEPSLIFSSLPIEKNRSIEQNSSIGYFPAYKNLSPEEKYIYFKWLENPYMDQDIDIGYIFLYYYGLERHLYVGKTEKAIEAILKLLQYYKNSSFMHYATESLLFYGIHFNNKELLKSILKIVPQIKITPIGLYVCFILKEGINAEDIISLAKKLGFKNDRYIKTHYSLFKDTLEKNILLYNCKKEIPLSLAYSAEIKKIPIIAVANISLRKEDYFIDDLLSNEKFSEVLRKLLETAHEEVKIILNEERKKKNYSNI